MNSFWLYEKEKLKKLYVVSFGKAASLMVRSLADGVGNTLTRGIVITGITGTNVMDIQLILLEN
jgi:glycerate-2-kinase